MPLVKRKPVELVPPPTASGSDDPEVFYLEATGEVFADFESYSNRLTFYNQKVFQCELTGRINLTYFEALKSERKEAIALHKIFPEQLKAPVLKSVQFQITGRIDQLVDQVYDRFKDRFFPGETVYFDFEGEKYYARMTKVEPPVSVSPPAVADGGDIEMDVKQEPNGYAESSRSTPRTFSALTEIHTVGTNLALELEEAKQKDDPSKYVYIVDLIDDEDEPNGGSYTTSSEKLSRDRLAFSKTILRKYLRDCIIRAANIGAEWRVKEWLAVKYGIPLEPSDEITSRNEELKDAKLSKRKKYLLTDGEDPSASTTKKIKGEGKKLSAAAQRKADEAEKAAIEKAKEEERLRKKNLKYPIEDLELDPITKRELMFKIQGEYDRRKERPIPGRGEHALPVPGKLLPTFIATYHFLASTGKTLLLSPFTMDDYEQALHHKLSEPSCTLINEIHRTLINLIVRDGGSSLVATTSALAATLDATTSAPASVNGDADDDDGASQAASDVDELDPTPSQGNPTNGHSNAQVEALTSLLDAAHELSSGWEKLIIRPDNRRERWENSLMGLIAARGTPDLFPRMVGILSHLAAVEHADGYIEGKFEAELYDTPAQRYPLLSLGDKLQIIDFLCSQAVETKSIKAFYEDCEAQVTELRKEKIEVSREKKELAKQREEFEGSRKKDEDGEEGGGEGEVEGEVEEGEEADEDQEEEEEEEEEEDELASDSDARSIREDSSFSDSAGRRGGASRQEILRQKAIEKRAQEAQLRIQQAKAREAHKAKLAENKIFTAQRKKLDDEEAKLMRKDEIIEREFRRLLFASRVHPLGKDRFGDKYYWFDGVGSCSLVVGGGVGEKLTYQSGRLFIQAATIEEVSTLIPESSSNQVKVSAYAHLFHQPITRELIESRKAIELGGEAGILQPGEWGVYSEPERIEELISWLRTKGYREHALKAQLIKFRFHLESGMKKRNHDLNANLRESFDSVRRSSRSTKLDGNAVSAGGQGRFSYLAWKNTLDRVK
ncbi:related to ITC1 - subunit of Isw2 chromatin remodelling complex [Melanopsichium pennsylvanicum]|uniref:Related to ITC1 - subunit of Isw2 chromatin remodelling complex n=2 Tax=Melanopsichium pennsylvanicum TaxID=63383 RepID=A0AAJ4XQY7_9BASI|nr:related to ITC1 - subunit of Isw2 chromatin remodelling complex [Melanopsichium pennsylvanicum]